MEPNTFGTHSYSSWVAADGRGIAASGAVTGSGRIGWIRR